MRGSIVSLPQYGFVRLEMPNCEGHPRQQVEIVGREFGYAAEPIGEAGVGKAGLHLGACQAI
jgi:hypothetical protein